MNPFETYSEEQRTRIVECLSSVIDKNTNVTPWIWNGDGFTPTKAETAQQFEVGEIYELRTAEEHFNAVVDELEVYARCYKADIARESAVSKSKLEEVAALCAKLAGVLPDFRPEPHLLGLGVNRERRTIDGELMFVWDLTDKSSFKAGVNSKQGKDELLTLVNKLRSIEEAISKGMFLVGAGASKRRRNEYLKEVLNRWLDAGGIVGGPNSAMVDFFRAVCAPVLGKNYPTDGALVKLAYALARAKSTTTRLKPLKLSKIKG